MVSSLKLDIQEKIYGMNIGERLRIDRQDLKEGFSCGYPSIYNTHREALLSSLIGSAYGTFRAEECPHTGDLIVSRHEESNERYYVDPDRAHMFKQGLKGTLIPKE